MGACIFPATQRTVQAPPVVTVYRHPSQLYEVALGLFVLGSLYLFDKKLGEEKRPRGAMISLFFAIYFTGRFVVEYFKEFQAWAVGMPLTEGQIYSIVPALAGYIGLAVSLKKKVPAHWYTDADDELRWRTKSDHDAPVQKAPARATRTSTRNSERADRSRSPKQLRAFLFEHSRHAAPGQAQANFGGAACGIRVLALGGHRHVQVQASRQAPPSNCEPRD